MRSFIVLACLQVVHAAYFKISAGLTFVTINAFRICSEEFAEGGGDSSSGTIVGLLCLELMVPFVSEGLTM